MMIRSLQPLCGGIWLATDLATLHHWVIQVDRITSVTRVLQGHAGRAFGLATLHAPDGTPVFVVNAGDAIEWLEPDQAVSIRELGRRDWEIRLERLDDLDARVISSEHLNNGSTTSRLLRTMALEPGRLLQIYDEQLLTGSDDADSTLADIERAVRERRSLSGTSDALSEATVALDRLLRAQRLDSYIWAAVIREQVEGLRRRQPFED